MFIQILLFDLKTNLKRPTTWIFFAIFFVLTCLITAAAGGLIGSTQGESNTYFNSAIALGAIINSIVNNSLVGTIILVAIIAPSVQKDFQYNSHSIYFTKPISKFGYIFGRFFSGVITALIVLSACVWAFLIMCNLPLYTEGTFGNYNLWNYLQGFVYLIIPNTFFVGALFFAIVTYTRNMLSGYIASVALLVLMGIAQSLTREVDNSLITSLIDPYGNTALNESTKYWSATENNTFAIPFSGYLLFNRLFWITTASIILFVTYLRFSFHQTTTNSKTWFKRKNISDITNTSEFKSQQPLSKVHSVFDNALSWRLFTSLSKLEYKNLIKSPFFIVMIIIALVSVYTNFDNNSNWYGTGVLPVSYIMVDNISTFGTFMGNIIIVFYAGVLVWRERDSKMDEIISATPIKNWVLLLSKITSLVLMYYTLIAACVLFSILLQLGNGFTDIQPIIYIKSLFGYGFITTLIVACLCIGVQVLFDTRYLGYFVCIIILMIIPIVLEQIDVNNYLINFNSSGPSLPYSDMNGFGHRFFPFVVVKTYWLAIIAILLIITNLLWQRGKEQNWKSRVLYAKHSITKKHIVALSIGLVVVISMGSFINYNTRILNKYSTSDQQDEISVNYEKRNKKYNRLAKLKVVDVNVHLDIFPETRSIKMQGDFWLKNKGNKLVDTLFISYSETFKNYQLSFPNYSTKTIINDTLLGEKLIVFSKPILEGDSINMKFSFIAEPNGFSQDDAKTNIVENGTFLNSQILFPAISYDENSELEDKIKRKKYGLPEKERMHEVTDSIQLRNNVLGADANWVRYECTISTTNNQTAISPGYLVKKWTENNRNYFHYKMDKPINYFMSYQSARYEIKTSKWKNVNIEIYYDKKHSYNIDNMIAGIKKSFDYYCTYFSPYQFKQMRIQEFPRYASFAQSFANTVPYSEAVGFIAAPDFNKEDAIDYTFFVTAHEVAHQWWAHQVISGNVKGAFMNSESFAEYSALRVMEKEYGKKAMRKFLKYELDTYLRGRASNKKNEDVLVYCQGDSHIHYQKGALIMYGVSDLIGEQKMNDVLKAYLQKTAFQEAPYTTSLEFLNMLKAITPDSLKYAIVDGFEKITLYENRCKDVSFTKLPNGKYKVTVTVEAMKLYADGKGKKTLTNMNDYIDIGIFSKEKSDKETVELYNVKHKLKSGLNTFEVIVDKEPYSAGIDPYIKLIDRNSEDNVRKTTDKAPLKTIDINDDASGVTINLN